MNTCKSCGAPIVWAVTEEGKRIPLDGKPEKRFIVEDLPDKVRLVSTFQTHFVTCLDAAEHRKLQ